MYTTYVSALLALGAGLSAAMPITGIEKRSVLSSSCQSRLQALGTQMGANAADASSSIWVGNDGPYSSSFVNNSPQEICLVVWGNNAGYQSSFVGAAAPYITASIPAGSSSDLVLSFADGQSGAWAGVWPDTTMSQYGQIYDTWGEFTTGAMGVVDVSREVNPNGHHMRIKTPSCTSTMKKCVFKCVDPSATTCGEAGTYRLENCEPGTQPGAGVSSDGANGGCGWEGATSASFLTTFH